MARDLYPIIGMSPGNSYFKDDEVRYLLQQVVRRYGKTAILIADTPAISTYRAFGYPEAKARSKAILKGNNLKNRTRRVMEELGFDDSVVRIIEWESDIESEPAYQKAYQHVSDLYKKNALFSASVDATTRAVLEHSERDIAHAEEAVKIATHYLLSELAFLEYAPAYLHSEHIAYVYHKNWPVYEDYIAGRFDGQPKLHLNFLLLENPYETYITLEETEGSLDPFESAYDRMHRTKCIRAGYEDYTPAFMTDSATGVHTGIFHDILERFAQEQKWTVRFTEETGYGVIIEGLEQKRFDIFATTVWPTPERLAAASFSMPVYFSDVYLWIRSGEKIDTSQENLNFRLAIKENDISHSIAAEDFSSARLVYAPQLSDPMTLLTFVAEGRADGTFMEPYLAAQFNAGSSVQLVAATPEKPIRRFANTFMFRRGEEKLKEALDQAIQRYMQEGFVSELIEKYTGKTTTFH